AVGTQNKHDAPARGTQTCTPTKSWFRLATKMPRGSRAPVSSMRRPCCTRADRCASGTRANARSRAAVQSDGWSDSIWIMGQDSRRLFGARLFAITLADLAHGQMVAGGMDGDLGHVVFHEEKAAAAGALEVFVGKRIGDFPGIVAWTLVGDADVEA